MAEDGAIHRDPLGYHELGNHTFIHPDLARLDHDQVRDELIRPGSIVLGHDSGATERLIAIDRLPRVLARLKDDGWTFYTVSGLLNLW